MNRPRGLSWVAVTTLTLMASRMAALPGIRPPGHPMPPALLLP
jgi:hypothetical protein